MDNPGLSLFQDAGINIDNAQNLEEEEDLEEQRRRQEELQNLLSNALDDFKYDDSTMNSSANASMISNEHFKDVALDDQLKVLYDIRVREITNLKQEYDQYKDDKEKEVNSYKQKLLLYEAEVRHLQTSLHNADSLIEEKIASIRKLDEVIHDKDNLISQLKKNNEQNELEIDAYKMTVNELQLKLNNMNPLYLGSKRFQSEELQKAHQEQVTKLEELLQEQTRKADCLEHEKQQLQEEFEKISNNSKQVETDTTNTIAYFTTNLNSAQQQCRDLLDVVDALTKENEHIRQRLQTAESNSPIKVRNLQSQHVDSNTLSQHLEKLKKMLLDKDTELMTLRTKLKFYERDMKELLEYRNIKNNVTSFDFNACGDMSNNHHILILQNELKNYKTLLKEKDNHIGSLQLVNKELQEKIEEMLEETRNQIQSISHKYSLPQLEKMSADLSTAQTKITELEDTLAATENMKKEVSELNSGLDEMYKFTRTQLENVQAELLSVCKAYANEKQNLESKIQDADEEMKRLQNILAEFKHVETDLKEHNTKLEGELRDTKSKLADAESSLEAFNDVNKNKQVLAECEQLKQQIKALSSELDHIKQSPNSDNNPIITKLTKELDEAVNKIHILEEGRQELMNTKTIMEGEKSDLEYQLKEAQQKLQIMEKETTSSKKTTNDDYIETETLRQTYQVMQDKVSVFEEHINLLQTELAKRENIIDNCNKDKIELKAQLEEFKKKLTSAEQQIEKMYEDYSKLNTEFVSKFSKQVNETEKQENEVLQSDIFKNLLQAEVLRHELKARDDIQIEYNKTINTIHTKYKDILDKNNKKYKDEIEDLKKKENNYRLQFGQILSECGERISKMEDTNLELKKQLGYAENEFANYKVTKSQELDELIKLLKKVRLDAENTIASWKTWSKSVLLGCVDVERISQKSRQTILSNIESGNAQYKAIEKSFDTKIKKVKKHFR